MEKEIILKKKNPKVMIVDDEDVSREILGEMIEEAGYETCLCDSAKSALEFMQRELPDLILSDVAMPEMDGFALCQLVKEEARTKNIPFMFVSGMDSTEEKIHALKLGAVDYITKPYVWEEVKMRVETHLNLHLMKHQLEQYNYQLNVMVKKQMKAIENAKKTALVALAKVTEGTRKITTENHLENVAYNARILAQALSFSPKYENRISEKFIELIETCSMIHDIGKIGIPESILLKPGDLTREEAAEMRTHTVQGADIFEEIFADMQEDEFMIMARNVVLSHHERYDGTGYPYGLKGEAIPLEARIVAVVDVYDTLRSERCYKPAYDLEEAKHRMNTLYKGYFDPDIIEVFWKVERQMKKGKS